MINAVRRAVAVILILYAILLLGALLVDVSRAVFGPMRWPNPMVALTVPAVLLVAWWLFPSAVDEVSAEEDPRDVG